MNCVFFSGCAMYIMTAGCDHRAAFILRPLIIMRNNVLPLDKYGIPYASAEDGIHQFPLEITNSPPNVKGTYYLRTGKLTNLNL